jgi:thioredoxin
MRFGILSILLFVVISVTSCNKGKEETAHSEKINTGIIDKPIQLTRSEFLVKVMDYENNPQGWNYLGDKPCIIDFYASWCPPCKYIEPFLNELAKEHAGEIYIYKVDVDKQPELANFFSIQSIPTLFFCPLEGNPEVIMGALEKEDLKEKINTILLKK